MTEYAVALFKSTHHGIKAERVALKAGIEAKLIPAPRHLSRGCGVALQFPRADREQVETVLRENSVEYERIEDLDS